MNKKIITSISIISLLSACSSWTKPYDTKLLKKNSISATVDAYYEYKKVTKSKEEINENRKGNADIVNSVCFVPIPPLFLGCPFVLLDKPYDYTTLAEKDSLDCWYLNDNSDKCIVYRRNHKIEDSKVNFFDYKRFLPKDSNIKTDDDFLRLVKYKMDKDKEVKSCDKVYEDNSLTSTERQKKYTQCMSDNKKNNIEGLLKSYIFEGGLEEEKKQEQLKKELAQQRKTEYINDCDQAEKKADEANKKANKKLEKYKKSINYDSLKYFNENEIVDIAKNGVFINYCKEHSIYTLSCIDYGRYFIYTKDTNYANGDIFRNGGVFYEQDGFYKYTTITGATNSVRAYRPTKIKIKDVEKNIEEMKTQTNYHLYLKNKNILDCKYGYDDYIRYKDENGEEHRIYRE